MLKRMDEHLGFVWGVKGEDIVIQLQIGGKLRTKNGGNFDTGDRVAIIYDAAGHVVEVIPREIAERAVKIGSCPFFEVGTRDRDQDTHIFDIEEDNYGYSRENGEVFGIC